jgi:general secretion pathway protein H
VRLLTSRHPRRADTPASDEDHRRGAILLDAILALAVAGLLLLVVLPFLPTGTSAARQGAYALEIAALLKTDRTAAARLGAPVATQVDVEARRITSGSTSRVITLPRDLILDVLASDACVLRPGVFAIAFASDGRSCGAVIRITKNDRDWRVRINWLTGFVDVLAPERG